MEQPVFKFDSRLQPEFAKAPQPYYRQMRDTNPVMRLPDMYGSERSNVFVAKHSDIDFVRRNPELFSSDFLPPAVAPFPMIPEDIDPPEHKKYRRLLDPRGNEWFVDATAASDLVAEATRRNIQVLGLEGFLIDDAGTYPAISWIADFSADTPDVANRKALALVTGDLATAPSDGDQMHAEATGRHMLAVVLDG
jgi:hypothetical protein